MHITKDTHLCISIIVTGRCNCNCEYCHFFANHDRNEYNIDIDDDLFQQYIFVIQELQKITPHITCRFSGGEPLFMGKKVFELSEKLYQQTGLKPYILSNGQLLSKENIHHAKENHISSFVVSVENPFLISKGAFATDMVIEKFSHLQNKDVPLFLGMLVLPNHQFKNIKKIADYFWDKIKMIPPMCEVNFLPYRSPTQEELDDLYHNVYQVVKEYNGKSNISLFPYIIPEYYPNNSEQTEFLVEFPLVDTMNIKRDGYSAVVEKLEIKMENSYSQYACPNINCDWADSCKVIKWVWKMNTDKIPTNKKLEDYCRFKKVLSQAFYDALSEE